MGGPIGTRSTRLNCICKIFSEIPLLTIFGALKYVPICTKDRRQQQDFITCKIRSQFLFYRSLFLNPLIVSQKCCKVGIIESLSLTFFVDLCLKFVNQILLFGPNLVSNWFRLHQKVLALIYYIRKLFTPLKNPAFTARVHFSPISTEIQIRQSREKYIPSAASIENFYYKHCQMEIQTLPTAQWTQGTDNQRFSFGTSTIVIALRELHSYTL